MEKEAGERAILPALMAKDPPKSAIQHHPVAIAAQEPALEHHVEDKDAEFIAKGARKGAKLDTLKAKLAHSGETTNISSLKPFQPQKMVLKIRGNEAVYSSGPE